jgi:hypothetical protein
MQLALITDTRDVDRYQRTLKANFERGTVSYRRTVQAAKLTYPCSIHWDQKNGLWAHFGATGGTRFWNAFGIDDPQEHKKYVRNVVQVNPSRTGHLGTGGAFVRDPESDSTFLAHSGRIGGESIGQTSEFLRRFEIVTVNARDKARPYTIIAEIEDPSLNARLAEFVRTCAAFKDGKKVTKKTGRSSLAVLSGDEYAGKIAYERRGYVATTRLHGRVFKALKRQLRERGIDGLLRDENRDLFFLNDGRYVLFEIKTGAAPYDIYTAVGQLMLHGEPDKRGSVCFLVAPSLPTAFANRLRALGIRIISYRDAGEKIRFVGIDDACRACGGK